MDKNVIFKRECSECEQSFTTDKVGETWCDDCRATEKLFMMKIEMAGLVIDTIQKILNADITTIGKWADEYLSSNPNRNMVTDQWELIQRAMLGEFKIND